MRKEWRFVYKCRLCGGFDGSTVTGDKDKALLTVVEAVHSGVSSRFGIPVCLVSSHLCANGAIGVTDLHGAAEYPVNENPPPGYVFAADGVTLEPIRNCE